MFTYNLSACAPAERCTYPIGSKRDREGREIDEKARLYNRKEYPIPDFQIIRCSGMPCGTFWKWIDPFESNLINTELHTPSYRVVDTKSKGIRSVAGTGGWEEEVRKRRIVTFGTICLLLFWIPVNVTYVESRTRARDSILTYPIYVRCIFKLSLDKG